MPSLPYDREHFGLWVRSGNPRNDTHNLVVDPRKKIRSRRQRAAVGRTIKRIGDRRRNNQPIGRRTECDQDHRANRSDRLPTHLAIRRRCQPTIAHVAQSRHQSRVEVHRRTNHQIVAVAAVDDVASVAADQHVGSLSAQQRVVAESAQHQVVAIATIEPILSRAADHGVVADAADHVVVAITDGHAIVAVARVDPLAERTAQDAVVTIERVDDHSEVARHRETLRFVERRRHRPHITDRNSLLQSETARHTGQVNHVRTLVAHNHDSRDQRRRQIREDLL